MIGGGGGGRSPELIPPEESGGPENNVGKVLLELGELNPVKHVDNRAVEASNHKESPAVLGSSRARSFLGEALSSFPDSTLFFSSPVALHSPLSLCNG